MEATLRLQRSALTQLVRSDWTEFWVVAPRLGAGGVELLLPHLKRPGARVRVLTYLTASRLADGEVDIGALQELRDLPNCEVRSLTGLTACIYAAGPDGPALVTGAGLRLPELEADFGAGVLLNSPAQILREVEGWWAGAIPLTDYRWVQMLEEASRRIEARSLGQELARVGAFVRVSVRGTRKSRRLDPREYGAAAGEWGRAVRPVEVALFKLDEVVRAREELERVLAEKGLEWNGQYLVTRQFLEHDWPRIFAARERQLRERLASPEGQAALKAQIALARLELEAFFAELYSRVEAPGMDAPTWIETQVTRLLTETVTDTVLAESGLEYRVLSVLPEDQRSIEELGRLLQDPRLRSVQLTFNF